MDKPKIGYVFAMNKDTEQIAIRSFENTGADELDYDEVLDEVCYEVEWNCVWSVHYGKLTPKEISEIIINMRSYVHGGD